LFDEWPAGRIGKAALVDPDAPVIGILAGSRKSIAKHNFPHQLEVARVILDAMPRAKFLVPTTPATHEVVSKIAVGFPNLQIHPDAFDQVVPRCDLCLSVSGTATLHTAAYGVPMVVVYRVNPFAWHLVGRWIVKTRTYSMVNYLSGEDRHIVPEHIPWYGGPDAVAGEVLAYLRQPAKLAEQRGALARVVASLDRPGASKNAAELALSLIN
jgi:lipid-A-disaccharide synthase